MASTLSPSNVGSGVNCDDLVRAAFVCIQVTDPTQCSCFGPDPTTFTTDFEQATREAFMSTMAFADPTAPNYCDVANEKVCDNYEATQSCCCTPETEEARKCLVENVLSTEMPFPLAAPCTGVCASAEEGGGGGSSTLIIGVAAVGAVVLLLAGGYFWWRRRNRVQAENSDDVKKDAKDVRSSGGTSTEDEKGMDADIEKGDDASSFKSDSSSSSSSSEESSHPKSKQQPPRPPPQVMTKNESPRKERESRGRERHSDRSEGSRERDEERRRERDHREKQSDRSEWPPQYEGRHEDRDRGDRRETQSDRPERPPSQNGRYEDRDRDYRRETQNDRAERRPSYEGRYDDRDRDRDYRRENQNDRSERPKYEGRYDDRDHHARVVPAEEQHKYRAVPSKAAEQHRSSKSEDLRKKRQAIETWNSQKKQGSNRSLNSYVSGASSAYTEESVDSDDEGTMTSRRSDRKAASSSRRKTSTSLTQAPPSTSLPQAHARSEAAMSSTAAAETKDELMKVMMAKLEETTAALNAKMELYQHDLERVAVDKSISKKRVKALSEDREATTLRLNQLEEARSYHEGRLQAAEHEVGALRKERIEAAKRIADLEAQNAHLAAQLKRSAVLSSATPGEGIADITKKSSSSRRRRERHSSVDLKRASSASSLIEGNDHGEGRKSSGSSRRRREQPAGFVKAASSEDLATSWNHSSIQSRSEG